MGRVVNYGSLSHETAFPAQDQGVHEPPDPWNQWHEQHPRPQSRGSSKRNRSEGTSPLLSEAIPAPDLDNDLELEPPRRGRRKGKGRGSTYYDGHLPSESFQELSKQVSKLQQTPEIANAQSNYLFGQQRTAPADLQTLLRSAQSATSSVSGAETVYVAQEIPTPMLAPSTGAGLGTGQRVPEAQRLATLDLGAVNASQRELIERSMNIGGISSSTEGLNARVNADRDQNRARGQDQFVTPEFFSMDFSQHRQGQPGQTLLTFRSSEAKAKAELVRQRLMQQQQQQGQQTGSAASSSTPPPQNTMISEDTPSASFIEVDLPTPQTQPQSVAPAAPSSLQQPTTNSQAQQTSPQNTMLRLPVNVLRTMETMLQSQQSHNENRERITHDINAGRSIYRLDGEVVMHDPADDDVKCTI